MRTRLFSFLTACVLAFMHSSARATGECPTHEVWIGIGGAASFEKNIFNVPDDIKSSPDDTGSLLYMFNLDSRRAIGIHIYGGDETTPEALLLTPSGGTLPVKFDLTTFNIGVRGRYTFSRGTFAPYAFVGASWANGTIESGPTGSLDFNGVSGCVGAGVNFALSRHFLLGAEGIGSFGTASWKQRPFSNSSGNHFNPSIAGGTVNLGFAWGELR